MLEKLQKKADDFMEKHGTFLQEVDCYEFLASLDEDEKKHVNFFEQNTIFNGCELL